jgi:hypothetical protein
VNWRHEQTSLDMLEFLLEENNLRPLLFSHGLTELDITFVKAGGREDFKGSHWNLPPEEHSH